MLELLHKVDDIAKLATSPAPIALPPRIDVERRLLVVVEGTQALEGGTRRTQGDIGANDGDDVAGLLHLILESDPVVQDTPGS